MHSYYRSFPRMVSNLIRIYKPFQHYREQVARYAATRDRHFHTERRDVVHVSKPPDGAHHAFQRRAGFGAVAVRIPAEEEMKPPRHF